MDGEDGAAGQRTKMEDKRKVVPRGATLFWVAVDSGRSRLARTKHSIREAPLLFPLVSGSTVEVWIKLSQFQAQ